MVPVFIIGCGDVGRRVARFELADGRHVAALARSDETARVLSGLDIVPVRGDLDDPQSLIRLPLADAHVYYFAPPPAEGRRDSRMQHFLGAITARARPARLVLISTSGVYGDCHGEWVTEDRPPHPDSDRAHRRLDAERQMLAFAEANSVPVVILRVPGIYGPGRLPVRRIEAREPVLREVQSPWSNRVHIDDLVAACCAAMRRGHAGAVYNVSDGHPTTMTDYFNRVADTLGLLRPPQISLHESPARLSAGMQSYLAESKRLDNRRMREELGVELVYPDLSTGLAACVAGQTAGTKRV